MNKQYALLLLNTIFVICAAADYQSDYNAQKTRELRAIANKIDGRNHKFQDSAPEVLSLVQANADPNLPVPVMSGNSLLESYVFHNNEMVVDCLITGKADTHIVTRQDGGNLVFSARSPAMVQLLSSKGVNLHHRALPSNNSALHSAAVLPSRSAQVVAALCEAGLDPNLINGQGNDVLTQLIIHMKSFGNNESIQKACILLWYGDMNNAVVNALDNLKSQNEPLATRLQNCIAIVSSKKEKAKGALAVLLASHLNEITVLGNLITDYSGAPGLTARHVDRPGEMIQSMQDDAR